MHEKEKTKDNAFDEIADLQVRFVSAVKKVRERGTGKNVNCAAVARAFGCAAIRSWWREHTKLHRSCLGLREPPDAIDLSALTDEVCDDAAKLGRSAALVDSEVATYFLGRAYSELLPPKDRAELGMYFTPPALVRRLLDLVEHAGVDWSTCQALDPASGGGAFLLPLANRMLNAANTQNRKLAVQNVFSRIQGYEIDRFAAWISQVGLDTLCLELKEKDFAWIKSPIQITDTLYKFLPDKKFDLVVGNPPYGRIRLNKELRSEYKRCLFGHANLYGLFSDIAIRHAKTSGVVGLVTPTSFLSGEYFKNLRDLLGSQAPPVGFDFVANRKGVFSEVLQETVLAVYKKGAKAGRASIHELRVKSVHALEVDKVGEFQLPNQLSKPWIVGRTTEQTFVTEKIQSWDHSLEDWGYTVSTGPLVWNRHKSQLKPERSKNCFPLIWAESVLPTGRFNWRATRKNHLAFFKVEEGDEWLVRDRPCVLVQRTTAKEQKRRLIAAELPHQFVSENHGVVVENHLNMILPIHDKPKVEMPRLAEFLNSDIADSAFRCVSGSVAVSAYELKAMPLPSSRDLADVVRTRVGASGPYQGANS